MDRSVRLSYLQALLKWESVIFATICITDLCTTLFWVHVGVAKEANPLLAGFLQQGDLSFCLVKLISFVPMLLLSAWYRMYNPHFIAVALRFAIAAYLLIYLIGVVPQLIR
jgi:hypothetical protein